MTNDIAYWIYSAIPSDPSVGIFVSQVLPTQPVRLQADIVPWTIDPPLSGGGPHRLGVSHYKYTTELEGEVIATNAREASREWFIIPTNEKDIYAIAIESEQRHVWTASQPGQPIKIEPFKPGDRNQLFKIVQGLRE